MPIFSAEFWQFRSCVVSTQHPRRHSLVFKRLHFLRLVFSAMHDAANITTIRMYAASGWKKRSNNEAKLKAPRLTSTVVNSHNVITRPSRVEHKT